MQLPLNFLIAYDPDYIERLRQHPGLTIFARVASVEPYDAVAAEAGKREEFIARQPAYLAAIMNRTVTEFLHYQRYEKPVISDLSSGNTMYVHSAAGPYEISVLKNYLTVQKSLEVYRPRISTKA